jgi:hypothetical protein
MTRDTSDDGGDGGFRPVAILIWCRCGLISLRCGGRLLMANDVRQVRPQLVSRNVQVR